MSMRTPKVTDVVCERYGSWENCVFVGRGVVLRSLDMYMCSSFIFRHINSVRGAFKHLYSVPSQWRLQERNPFGQPARLMEGMKAFVFLHWMVPSSNLLTRVSSCCRSLLLDSTHKISSLHPETPWWIMASYIFGEARTSWVENRHRWEFLLHGEVVENFFHLI